VAAAPSESKPASAPLSAGHHRIIISSDEDGADAKQLLTEASLSVASKLQDNPSSSSIGCSFLRVTKPMSSLSFEDVLRYNVRNRDAFTKLECFSCLIHLF
jgi:hypothetical protein